MIKKVRLKSMLKEMIKGALLLFILTNIISYVRQPKLSSNQLPKLEVKLIDGSYYRVSKSKPLVLHFWGTWCPTCKLEIANIEHISKSYNVLTIAVNSGDDSKINNFMRERGLTFKVINDNSGEWAKKFNVEVYPTTFIYDKKGELKFTEVGYTTTVGLLARVAIVGQ
jgi:thiol-disulfide isomerase/thioredoxin